MAGDRSPPRSLASAAGPYASAGGGKGRLLTTVEAASRLGVKPSTLYAYVSRGMLTSSRGRGGTGSLFDAGEVERLAARSRAGGRAGRLEVIIDSSLTMLDPAGRLYYRGVDVVALCGRTSFEVVAELLWTGSRDEPRHWTASTEALAVGAAVQGSLPAAAALVDRIRATASAIGPADPLRHDRHPAAVARCASGLVTALVESLPLRPHSRRAAGRRTAGEAAGAGEGGVGARAGPSAALGGAGAGG